MADLKTSRQAPNGRRELLVSRTWVQAVALVVLFGFAVLGSLAYRTYTAEPPIPGRVVTPAGDVLFTGDDITRGQQVFLRNGLMQYGSIFGHGAYLGPDFTADYLHRAAEIALGEYGGTGSDTARQQVIEDFKTNRYDAASNTLTYTDAQATAFEELIDHYRDYFGAPTTERGLRPEAITDQTEIRQLTAYFSWSAWAGPRFGRGRTTPSRTTGHQNVLSTMLRRRMLSCGACCRLSRCLLGSVRCSPPSGDGVTGSAGGAARPM
jgi:nitric oxide reductase subunit B